MSKVLIDRALLERAVYSLELAYETDTPTIRDICSALSAPSGTPAMPVKAYYHEAPNEYGGFNKSVGLEVRKAFIDAPLVLESDALTQIACLEGEIAKRDARIVELESRYQRDVYGLNNEGDPIGGDPAGGYANDNARLRSELAAAPAALAADAGLVEARKANNELVNDLHVMTNKRRQLVDALTYLRECLDPEDYMGEISMHDFIDDALAAHGAKGVV